MYRRIRPLQVLAATVLVSFDVAALAQPSSQPGISCVWDICYLTGQTRTPDSVTFTEGGLEGSSMLKITNPRNGRTYWVLLDPGPQNHHLFVKIQNDPTDITKKTTATRGDFIASLRYGVIQSPTEFDKADLTDRISLLYTSRTAQVVPFFTGRKWGQLKNQPAKFGATHTQVNYYASLMNLKVDAGKGPTIGRVVCQDPYGGTDYPMDRVIHVTYDGETYSVAPELGLRFENAIPIEDALNEGYVEITEQLTPQHEDRLHPPAEGGKEVVWKLPPSIPAGTRVTAGRTDMGLPVTVSVWTDPKSPRLVACASNADPTLNFPMPGDDAYLVGELPGQENGRLRLYVTWPATSSCSDAPPRNRK